MSMSNWHLPEHFFFNGGDVRVSGKTGHLFSNSLETCLLNKQK